MRHALNHRAGREALVAMEKTTAGETGGRTMRLSIRYYVLSLGDKTNRLFEAFRDQLIDIQNSGFPYHDSRNEVAPDVEGSGESLLRDFVGETDLHFAHYYARDPLGVVVVGGRNNLSMFKSLTVHGRETIGTVEGDYEDTSLRDLGLIVWPVVKAAMAGTQEKALRDLSAAESEDRVVSGLEAVGRRSPGGKGSTLFVEEDYRLKGSISEVDGTMVVSTEVDLSEVLNDVVDIVIDDVLGSGGSVVFVEGGSLAGRERIALILPN
jgi:hypothetical protein